MAIGPLVTTSTRDPRAGGEPAFSFGLTQDTGIPAFAGATSAFASPASDPVLGHGTNPHGRVSL